MRLRRLGLPRRTTGHAGRRRKGAMARRLPSTPPVIAGFSPVHVLGSGGFADVFLYEQDMPRRQVAVKVLLDEVVDDRVRQMFQAEANLMARLSTHPSILTVFQASVASDGRPYLVMELCSSSLSERYRREPRARVRGAVDRRPHRPRARDGAPRGRAAPGRQALEHPADRVRQPGAVRLRHRGHHRRGGPRRAHRHVDPVVGARGPASTSPAARSSPRSTRSPRPSSRSSPAAVPSRCPAARTAHPT